VKGIEALEAHRKKVGDARRHDLVGERGSRHLTQPEINCVPPCLHGVEAVLKCLRGGTNELDEFPREGKYADDSLRLEADQRLVLSVERPLQAAEIEVDAHDGSLPEFSTLAVAPVRQMSVVLRRLHRRDLIHQVRPGRPHQEALYVREGPAQEEGQ